MVEDMNISEIAIKEAKENQTRKILEIIKESKSLEEATEKTKALLES